MAFESDNDRLAILKACGAETVNLALLDARNWDAIGILEKKYVETQRVQGYKPTLQIRERDIYHPDETPTAEFRAVMFNSSSDGFDIVEVQPDGTGMVLLILEKQ